MSIDTEPRVVDNDAEHRYELWVGDDRAGVIEYGTRPGVVELIHTEIEPSRDARLGHANIGITLDLYSSVLPSLQGEAAQAIDQLFTTT